MSKMQPGNEKRHVKWAQRQLLSSGRGVPQVMDKKDIEAEAYGFAASGAIWKNGLKAAFCPPLHCCYCFTA